MLECGLPPGKPAGDLQDGPRILSAQGEDGVHQGVGFDESSVQIYAERYLGVDLSGMGGLMSALNGDWLL